LAWTTAGGIAIKYDIDELIIHESTSVTTRLAHSARNSPKAPYGDGTVKIPIQ